MGVVSAIGLLSAITTFGLLTYILWHARFNYDARHPQPIVAASGSLPSFINSAPGAYLVSLFISHFIYGVGFTIGFRWTITQYISVGPLCDAQGTLLQIGDLGYAFWSGAIAYHTFNLLYFRQSPPNWVSKAILSICWTLQIILPIVGAAAVAYPRRLYDYSGGTWCWISGRYDELQLLFYFIPSWCSVIMSSIMYITVYVHTSRFFNSQSFSSSLHSSGNNNSEDNEAAIYIGSKVRKKARSLLIYPLVYAILLIPVSIVKMGSMAGWRSPFWLACLSGVFISSSGWLDVILFLYTRRAFLQEARRAARIRTKSRSKSKSKDFNEEHIRLQNTAMGSTPNNLEDSLGLGGVQAKMELDRLNLNHLNEQEGGWTGYNVQHFERSIGNQSDASSHTPLSPTTSNPLK